MINLTPINKKIQKRLFEKMDVLGRKTSADTNQSAQGGLTHKDMATRSTFLRMTSGQLNPVILMGGKLKDDGSMYGGYDDIYGSRTYKTGGQQHTLKELPAEAQFATNMAGKTRTTGTQGVTGKPKTLENKLKRPIPGVKGVDVTFKGGVRALREATITWTCWDFEELDFLMPHFLAHGKTVMIEWGWVYDKTTLQDLPDFVQTDEKGNKYLSADIYKNYRNKIWDNDGDFDMMVGVIKNFEFTTREDGGFDCQTILSSVGASILEVSQPNEGVLDPNITYNLAINENDIETVQKLTKAVGEEGTETDERGDRNSLINLNTSVSLKLFIKNIDRYIALQMSTDNYKNSKTIQSGGNDELRWKSNKFIARGINYSGEDEWTFQSGAVSEGFAWVRWGWFEDNILSKFLSVTSTPNAKPGDASYSPIITEFRSIERLLDTNSDDSPEYESVRIKIIGNFKQQILIIIFYQDNFIL